MAGNGKAAFAKPDYEPSIRSEEAALERAGERCSTGLSTGVANKIGGCRSFRVSVDAFALGAAFSSGLSIDQKP
jgi:hypothetical protein